MKLRQQETPGIPVVRPPPRTYSKTVTVKFTENMYLYAAEMLFCRQLLPTFLTLL